MAVQKKAKKSKKEVKEESRPVVTHVVEIIDEGGETSGVPEDSIKKEEVKEVVDDLKDEVEDVQDKVEELETKVEPEPEPAAKKSPQSTQDEKGKEVIEELFGDQTAGVATEISGESKGFGKSIFLWGLLVIGVAVLTGAGLLVIVRGPESLGAMFAKPTPTPTSTPSPTPTPVAPNRSEVTIEVLNGSGIAGAAAKVKEFLEGKGYKVGKTGNADTSNHKETEIHVKKDKEAYLSILKQDLREGYTIGTSEADLSDNSSYDVQIIVGKE